MVRASAPAIRPAGPDSWPSSCSKVENSEGAKGEKAKRERRERGRVIRSCRGGRDARRLGGRRPTRLVVKSGGVVEWGTERFPAPSLRASLSTVRVENGGGVVGVAGRL